MIDGQKIAAQVENVRERGVDLLLEDGGVLTDYLGALFDENGNAISLEDVRAAMLSDAERIARLEEMLTRI